MMTDELRSLLAALNSAIHVPQCIVVKSQLPRRVMVPLDKRHGVHLSVPCCS